ncbi:MAG: alanine--tRNA ligase [Acidobacteriota bacterium]|nr:alanine--tRNA ligase [Acidobacteriota bacterium]
MNAQRIRETFLDYFAARGHKIVASASLRPKDDPSLLFTNAGMNQFKSVFLGLETRGYRRAATVQKCMRVSGKHNDLEQVGRTAKHHTFFEMLGNFSFGDYFKREAVQFAWELVHDVFGLPADRLYATVYEDDDEAYELWRREIGIPAERVFRFGKKDNFWAMGDTGPCGPCSELHFDIDPNGEAGEPRALIDSGSDRFVELWNLVFMQYEQDGSGILKPLPRPSIDTGMGLERMAAVLQGKTSNWDTDLFTPIIAEIAARADREVPAGGEEAVAFRVIADHARAVAFLIGDGIMPANDGRGYVLRRLIRRAFRHGAKLGLDKPFVYTLMGTVADLMKGAYPEILTTQPLIARICRAEEERFAQTLASGLRVFQAFAADARRDGAAALSGAAAFKLYDTYGFPLDLTRELAEDDKLGVDEAGFTAELEAQKSRARQAWKGDAQIKERRAYESLAGAATAFAGYDAAAVPEARVVALFRDGAPAEVLSEGQSGEIILDRTPFYAEAGGQVGDSGRLKNSRFAAVVESAYYPVPNVRSHRARIVAGQAAVGDVVEAAIDLDRRRAVRANHTATHLLHAALREILGDHVKQAGSLVSPVRLRFDFTHFQALSPGEIDRVEALVNEKIRDDEPIEVREMSLEEGLRSGAMAIFEEKYGERVRMIRVGDFSRELCGGAHAGSTGQIGFFKITAETSVAAGLRRIEAVTGEEALRHVQEVERQASDAARILNVPRQDWLNQVERMRDSIKEKDHEIKALRRKLLAGSTATPAETIRDVGGLKVLIRRMEGLSPDEARAMADKMKQGLGSGIVLLGGVRDDKAFLVAAVSRELCGRVSAAALIKALAPLIGGGGGGRPDFAQAGGPLTGDLDKALAAGPEAVQRLL